MSLPICRWLINVFHVKTSIIGEGNGDESDGRAFCIRRLAWQRAWPRLPSYVSGRALRAPRYYLAVSKPCKKLISLRLVADWRYEGARIGGTLDYVETRGKEVENHWRRSSRWTRFKVAMVSCASTRERLRGSNVPNACAFVAHARYTRASFRLRPVSIPSFGRSLFYWVSRIATSLPRAYCSQTKRRTTIERNSAFALHTSMIFRQIKPHAVAFDLYRYE